MREGLKTEGKDRALVDLACDRNCSAMGLHDFFDDGQPKSGATGILRPRLIGPIKLLKEMWEVLRLDPIARILDSHTNLLPGCLQAYGHSSTRRRVVKRVVEEINQCLVEPLCAPNGWWDRLGFKRQGDSAVIGKQGQFIHNILYQRSQREWHEVKGRLTACERRKGQEGTSQGNEPPHLLKIVEDGFAIFLRGSGFQERHLQVALQYGQGSFHFVGGDVAKTPAELHRSLGTCPSRS